MFKAIKTIAENIPKFFTWLIPTIFVAPLLILLVSGYIMNQNFNISFTNLKNVIFFTLVVSIIAFLWSSLKTVKFFILNTEKSSGSYKSTITIDGKSILQYLEVKIGEYSRENLKVDILAKINLDKEVQPEIPLFLERVIIGDPYCPHCSRNLDYLRASWMADGVQIGYKCIDCKTEITRDRKELVDDAKAIVRKNFDDSWVLYRKEIKRITNDKPHKYVLPEY
jgi:hypothetical protein